MGHIFKIRHFQAGIFMYQANHNLLPAILLAIL